MSHHEEYEWHLLVLDVFLVFVHLSRREEGGQEEHLQELRAHVEQAGGGALPESVVVRAINKNTFETIRSRWHTIHNKCIVLTAPSTCM